MLLVDGGRLCCAVSFFFLFFLRNSVLNARDRKSVV